MKTKDLIFISIFAAITAVCAQISIYTPFSPVPVTLQVLAVFLSGAILGSRLGVTSQLVYILLGSIGLPVFSGFSGGPQVILGLYGGYIIGFPIASFVIGKLINLYKGKSFTIQIIVNCFSMLIGLIIIYVFGIAQYSLLSNVDIVNSIVILVVPFVIPDLLKLSIAAVLAYYVRNALIRAKMI